MRISGFITLSDPDKRNDPYRECINSALDLVDELIIVDGGITDKWRENIPNSSKLKIVKRRWPEEFTWDFISEQFNYGLRHCFGDWAIRIDCDYIFHEDHIDLIRRGLEELSDTPAVNFLKLQVSLIDRYLIKARCPIAMNIKKCPDIRFTKDGGAHIAVGDKELDRDSLPVGAPGETGFFNYDWTFKTKKIVKHDAYRFAQSRLKFYGKDEPSWGHESPQKAFEFIRKMLIGKLKKGGKKIPLEDHPKYIQNRIKKMTKDEFGYNAWGESEPADYFRKE